MNLVGRPLGAFLSKWSENSPDILHNYGFTDNGIIYTFYHGKKIKVMKYKTQHYDSDNDGYTSWTVEYNNNTFHHLDFFLDKNNKLVNTDVYTSQKNFVIGTTIDFNNLIDKECKICFKEYKNPKKLPCSHILCEECIDNIYISPTLDNSCPFCR